MASPAVMELVVNSVVNRKGNPTYRRLRRSDDEEEDPTESPYYANTLRIIKLASLLLIAGCALVGMVISKISFVSITSRMYTLSYSHPLTRDDEKTNKNQKSMIFFQLVFILVIPEIMCLGHCLLWGVIGKTSKNFPWPSRKAVILVSVSVV